jgi:hypothetical protein
MSYYEEHDKYAKELLSFLNATDWWGTYYDDTFRDLPGFNFQDFFL